MTGARRDEVQPFEVENDSSARRNKHDDLEMNTAYNDADEVKTEAQKPSTSALQYKVMVLVTCHALCASGLLVVNKWALKLFPFVWTLTTIQFLFAAVVTFTVGKLGLVETAPLELTKLRQFFPAAGMFFITITAGNAVVGVSNVDTFIVMRSVVPLPCAMLESLVLKEPCPAPLSWLGLVIILLGACVYSTVNQGLVVHSIYWVVLYLVLMPLDAWTMRSLSVNEGMLLQDGVLIKHLVGASGLSPWGLVLYNNVCAVIPGLLFSALLEVMREKTRQKMLLALGDPMAIAAIMVSSLAGLAISYFQLNVRKVISSTAFMVLGVSNKLLSVLMNQVAKMDTNSSLPSIGSVLLSIFGAIFFQQTVKGKGISQAPKQDSASSESAACMFVLLGILAAAKISYDQME